jgi:acetyl-CoA synthetase
MSYSFQISSFDEYKRAYKKSVDDPEGFWSEIASSFLWRKKWDKGTGMEFQRADDKMVHQWEDQYYRELSR